MSGGGPLEVVRKGDANRRVKQQRVRVGAVWGIVVPTWNPPKYQ